jgi:micrococcal nuclease
MIAALIVTALSIFSPELTGRVVSVTDGDTIAILVDQKRITIRLDGIDAPEKSQAFGTKSREALAGLVFGKTARVETRGKDRYGRTIGVVFIDGVNVNAKQVEAGFAWHYKKYSNDSELDQLEQKAKAARRGLWFDSAPVEPWNFRSRSKSKAA